MCTLAFLRKSSHICVPPSSVSLVCSSVSRVIHARLPSAVSDMRDFHQPCQTCQTFVSLVRHARLPSAVSDMPDVRQPCQTFETPLSCVRHARRTLAVSDMRDVLQPCQTCETSVSELASEPDSPSALSHTYVSIKPFCLGNVEKPTNSTLPSPGQSPSASWGTLRP